MKKNEFTKRLAEVLCINHNTLIAAIEVVEKELEPKAADSDESGAEKEAEPTTEESPIAAGATTSDKFDDTTTTDSAPSADTTTDSAPAEEVKE